MNGPNWIDANTLQPGHGLMEKEFVVILEDGGRHIAGWGGSAFTHIDGASDQTVFRDVKYWIMLPDTPRAAQPKPTPPPNVIVKDGELS